MAALRRRGCLLAMALLVFGVLISCVGAGLGLHYRAIAPRAVLFDATSFWIGDTCRQVEEVAPSLRCPPVYVIDIVLRTSPSRAYQVLAIPLRGPAR